MSHIEFAKYYFRTLVESLIAHPDALEVHAANGDDAIRVTPQCHSRDFGRIVGDGGRTYANLRLLMQLAGERHGHRIFLDRMPKTESIHELPTPFRPKKDWSAADTRRIEEILRKILTGILEKEFSIAIGGGHDQTIFKVAIDKHERLPISHNELIEAVSRILGAIGKNVGRDIGVTLA